MNTRHLVLTSLFLAFLCHLFVFNYFVVIFPIAPEPPKPKLFFLGPILKQGDTKQIPSDALDLKNYVNTDRRNAPSNNAVHMGYGETAPDKNPFMIQPIRKPLTPQTATPNEKVILKSTFDAPLKKKITGETQAGPSEKELEISPYRPLRFGTPKNTHPRI